MNMLSDQAAEDGSGSTPPPRTVPTLKPGTKRMRDDSNDNTAGDLKKRRTALRDQFKPRLACPFTKAPPPKGDLYRACLGPGWPSIHRLKEHLFRCHRRISCERCLETFDKDEDLIAHRRADTPCTRAEITLQDSVNSGIDESTMSQLKCRRKLGDQGDASKWFHIYKILFPGHQTPNTPYVDNENLSLSPDTQVVRHFAELLQRQLDDTITRELKEQVCLGSQHAIISDQLRDLFSRCLADTTQLYLHTRREMPSSPRCRSTSGFAESPSPISHAESSPPATTDTRLNDCNIDSGYFSMGTNDREQCMDIEPFPDSAFLPDSCIVAGDLDWFDGWDGCRPTSYDQWPEADIVHFSGE